VEAGFWLGSNDIDVMLIAGLTKLHRSWKKGKNGRMEIDITFQGRWETRQAASNALNKNRIASRVLTGIIWGVE